MNAGKSADVIFTTRRIPPSRPLRFLGEKTPCEETFKYLGLPCIGDLRSLVT